MKYKFTLYLGILAAAALFSFGLAFPAKADVCSQNTVVDVVARDPGGNYIPNASVEIFSQVTDANNHPKPGTRYAGATTDAVLGTAHLSFRNSSVNSANYVLKIRTVNNDAANFWYYNINLSCGETRAIQETLSGILFIIHDADGNLLPNASFDVYSQAYDASGNATAVKKVKVATLTTDASGQAKVYLPQGSQRSIDNAKSDEYALDMSRNGARFTFYGIKVFDEQLTTMNYFLSALRVKLQDAAGALLPSGTNVDVYTQTVGSDNSRQQGTKVGSFSIGSDGYGTFNAPAGIYVLAVKGQNNAYQYFWDIQIQDGQSSEYTLSVNQSFSSTNTCSANSQFTLVLHSVKGKSATGLKFELDEQGTSATGLPLMGNRVGGGTINSANQASFSFKPDPTKTYALKIWDKRGDLGEFWFFDAVRFVCNYDRIVTKSLPALSIVLRDSSGALKRNYNFSLYMQRYDVDRKPVFGSSDLIANLQTDTTGQATVYVSPYNSYNPNETGVYALSAKDVNGNTISAYNITIYPDKDYTFDYSFSGLNGELRSAKGLITPEHDIRLYQQSLSGGIYTLGEQLASTRTTKNGTFQLEYPAGTYALVVNDDLNRPNIFWNVSFKANNGYKKLVTNFTNISLTDPQATGVSKDTSLKLYSLSLALNGQYYRDAFVSDIRLNNFSVGLSLAAGPYLISYLGKGNQEYGAAFYANNGSLQNIKMAISNNYLVNPAQAFKVSANGSSGVSSSASSSSSSSSGLSSATANLLGRILLQVEDKGQAWYVNPVDGKKYYLGRPTDAFNAMRRFGLGISNSNFASLERNPRAFRNLAGRILIKTEDSGKAYYFDPTNFQLYYLGRPADAFNIMRNRGLGIKNTDLNKVKSGI